MFCFFPKIKKSTTCFIGKKIKLESDLNCAWHSALCVCSLVVIAICIEIGSHLEKGCFKILSGDHFSMDKSHVLLPFLRELLILCNGHGVA